MIYIATGDLTGVLADVTPFASVDKDVPAINCVRIEWDGQQLHAHATDRYRIAISTWDPDDEPDTDVQDSLFTRIGGADEPWRTHIPVDDAKELVANFKLPPKEQATPLSIDYDAERDRLKVARSRDTGYSAKTTVLDGQMVEFPDLRKVLTGMDVSQKVDQVVFDAKRIADFSKVRPRGLLELTFTGDASLVLVAVGKRFVGAIMPIRTGDDAKAED